MKQAPKLVHQPCPVCPSSDAASFWDNGTWYCHSCKQSGIKGHTSREIFQKSMEHSLEQDTQTSIGSDFREIDVMPYRNIGTAFLKKYGVVFRETYDGDFHDILFPYAKNRFKRRLVHKKQFDWIGPGQPRPLFGMDIFPPGTNKHIIITEGEFDAIAAYQMTGVPAVSVHSSSTALRNCTDAHKYLAKFERVYLCFDSDEPGQTAAQEVLKLFDPGTVYLIDMGEHKDANALLMAGQADTFKQLYFNAKKYRPESILCGWDTIREILEEPALPTLASFPFPTLQMKTKGIRPEVYLLSALEGVGKTEVMRAIEHHVLKTTDHNIGIIHLEEPKQRTVKGLAGYDIAKPLHLMEEYSKEATFNLVQGLFKREDRVYLYPQLDSEDPKGILTILRWLVQGCGCKIIFLDHISMLVSDYEGPDERKVLDYLSTKLEKLVLELGFALIMVSHINDDGLTRGSRNISKCAMTHIRLDRDIEAESAVARNMTKLTLKKNRWASSSGPAGQIYFDPNTFLLKEETPEGGLVF